MDGLPAVRAAPDVRSGYFAGDVFEQVDGGPLQVCNDLRRRSAFGFFLRVRPAHQARRNDETQGFRADARSVGDDKIAKAEKRFVLLPHGDVQERVAEESNAARLMFCGGAMRLGYGQCASPESTVSPDGVGVRNGLRNFLMNL